MFTRFIKAQPILLPIIYFIVAQGTGACLLHSRACTNQPITWLDALFTATSAVCVTGLAVVDTGTHFTTAGHCVLLALIELGGLGIISFTSLAFYLLKNRVSLSDRMAIEQSLLNRQGFHLGRFLIRILAYTLIIEACGSLLLLLAAPDFFTPFSAVFHSISAFCNAGFSLHRENLMPLVANSAANVTIMTLIILGGLGFAVLSEGTSLAAAATMRRRLRPSWHLHIVVRTTLLLIVGGWLCILLLDFQHLKPLGPRVALLASLFQSVTCRTAGFNTVDIGAMSNASLLFMILLMFIGGAPGSTAGGIKVTTAAVLGAFILAQMRGRNQVVLGRFAVDRDSVTKALTLLFLSVTLVFASTLAVDVAQGGTAAHTTIRGQFLEVLFEVVSAFGTVGLSTGLTPHLTDPGKLIIIALMFVGRLGPLALLYALQVMQRGFLYSRPEEMVAIG